MTDRCSACGREGLLMTAPPMQRCIDIQSCDEERAEKAQLQYKINLRQNHAKLIPKGPCVIVFRGFTRQHHVFARLGCVCADGKPRCDCIGWELVSELSAATVFSPESGQTFVKNWGGMLVGKPK